MASVFHLYNDAASVKGAIVEKYKEYAESEKKLYYSAVHIQCHWRGYITRKKIKYWNETATTIQRHVRGWLVRLHLPDILAAHYAYIKAKFYNMCALRIQAAWRGYWWRKNNFSVRELRAERERLRLIMERMREEMELMALRATEKTVSKEYLAFLACMAEVKQALFDKHHLLRTTVKEGVLSEHGSDELSTIEQVLKSMTFSEYFKKKRKLTRKIPNFKWIETDDENEIKFNLSTRIEEKSYERMLLTQRDLEDSD